MRTKLSLRMLLSLAAIAALVSCPEFGWGSAVSVLTQHDDNQRTGQNLLETALAPVNVTSNSFGKLFFVAVDGQLYAQPLIVPGVAIPGAGNHDVVIVATENDTVYAFDANTGGSPLWQRSLLPGGATAIPSSDLPGCTDLTPKFGITATPVIDASTGTIYVVALSKEGSSYVHRLHALDLTSGADKPNSPIVISPDENNFDPLHQHERPGLLLSGSTVFLASASHCDYQPYYGWVIGYDKTSLSQTSALNAAPENGETGIWMSGSGLASDNDGAVYATTGNGVFNADLGGSDYGDTFLKLSPSTLAVADYFTPFDQEKLKKGDVDLGSGAFLLLPDQPGPNAHLAAGAGKEGAIYLVNRDSMGQFTMDGPDNVVAEIQGQLHNGVWGMPAYFNQSLYFIAVSDRPKSFSLNNGNFVSNTPSQIGSVEPFNYPGATPVISANGTSNAILWAIRNNGNAELEAFDATNLANELYNSEQNSPRDHAGDYVKFAVPTVANGKVYVPAASELDVYGLLGNAPTAKADLIRSANRRVRQGQTINGGAFKLVNTSGTPENITAVTIAFSNHALFSKATLTMTSGGVERGALVTSISGTQTFSLKTLTVNPKKTAKFTLKLTGAKGSGLTASTQSVTAIFAGGANIQGLPLSLGQISPK